MNYDNIYMLLIIIWMFSGMYFFEQWLFKSISESMALLIFMTLLCGPIVILFNSMAFLVLLHQEYNVKWRKNGE